MNSFLKSLMRHQIQGRINLCSKRCRTHCTIQQLVEQNYFAKLLPHRSAKYLKTAEKQPFSVYLGLDPSASSLQLGNLVALIGFLRCHASGKNGIVVLGTSTVCVGDPSGRTQKRILEPVEKYVANAESIEMHLQRIFQNYREQFYPNIAPTGSFPLLRVMRNSEWLVHEKLMTFLTDVTSHFRMAELLEKESVRMRLNSGHGMDLNEFLYPVLQAMDFLHLYQHFNCQLQVGGHDQLGNITCGLNLIHRKLDKYAFGLTVPLLTTPDGQKLGKSVTGAGESSIWLDSDRMIPYSFYQRLLNLPDSYVSEQLLKQLTFLTPEQITRLLEEDQHSRERRPVQRALARELTLLVHGVDGLQSAELATRILFPQSVKRNATSERLTPLQVLATQLTPTEKNYMIQCLAPTARLLPVIHLSGPISISDKAATIDWFKNVLLRTRTDSSQEQSLADQAVKGVAVNDVEIFQPGSVSGQMALKLTEPDSGIVTEIGPRLSEALSRSDSNMGVHIVKIGKHEHWFVLNDRS